MSDQWGPPPQPSGQQQPGWGAPQPPSPKRRRRPGVLGWIGIGVAVLIVLGVIGTIAGQDDNTTTSSPAAPATTAAEQPAATEPETTEPETTEAPKQTGPATAKLGETLQFEDSFGKHSADITVTRKRVSTGDEFDKPSRGYYVGLFVHVKAYQDGITVPQFYALVGSKHFDSSFATGFEPDLNVIGNLNKGETAEGWVVFDVPSRNGKAVMQEFLSEKAQATWTY